MAKPKLRFPEFTDEWEEKQLKDFMLFKNGLNADKDKFGSGIKFISVMDILNNSFITYDAIRGKVDIDEKTLDSYSVTYGDVLFQRSSETREDAGKSNVYLDKENTATFGGFVIRGKKTGDYSPEFMNSLLKSPKVRKEITSKAQGAQHINVGQETLENVSIILPTIKEQETVAELLSALDDIIQVQEEKISTLEEQKKGMMQKLFNREVRFKADDGSEYPEWEEMQLGNIAVIKMGQSPDSSSYNDKCIGLPLIQGNADMSGRVSAPQRYTSEPTKECNMGDIIMTVRAPVGFVGKSIHHACIGRGVCAISSKINTEFLFQFLVSVEDSWKHIEQGSTFTAIGGDEVKKLRVLIPCVKEQQKVADCLSAYDEAIQIKKDKLEVWKKIKKGLLQQMFV